MDNEQSNHHNTNDCIEKCNKEASNERSNDLVNSKERKEIQNTQILCRTLSGNSSASSANKPTSGYNESNCTINEEGRSLINTSKAQKEYNHSAANSSCSDNFKTNNTSKRLNKDSVHGTAVLDPSVSGIEQASVRTKDNNRESSRKDFASRQAELQSMDVDDEKVLYMAFPFISRIL